MLGAIPTVLFVIGVIAFAVGWVWLVVAAFRTGLLWGVASLILYPFMIAFAASHWDESRNAVILHVIGILLYTMGWALQ